MTLPASGPISFQNITAETGSPTGYSASMSWVQNNSKPTVTNMDSLHNRAYYQSTTEGNCNNGNCSENLSSGNIQCQNCSLAQLANCVNCDTKSYLQPNCNCACTYNCTQVANQSYNCNCNCACACFVCACACSDERLKERVEPIGGALDKVDNLAGVYYNWTGQAEWYGKKAGERTMGVIANDTQKIIPEAVGYHEDMLTVDYGAINGLLIEAIKELRREIAQLKKVH